MDALSSISPFSTSPDARKRVETEIEPFIFDQNPSPPKSEQNGTLSAETHDSDGSAVSSASRACQIASGPSSPDAISRLAHEIELDPSLLFCARIERDERGQPIQAFPAVALAAIQGHDPEGWIPFLFSIGASFDIQRAKGNARAELFQNGAPRIQNKNARLDALSLWTLACAEATYPHSALRAIESVRKLSPQGIGPLSSELWRFSDNPIFDKPTLSPKSRAGAFIEAAKESEDFLTRILPAWICGPRGADAALLASDIAAALGPVESQMLLAALSGNEEAPAKDIARALSSPPRISRP